MARRGAFGASLTPFGGGVLNLDATYSIGGLDPTPDPPAPAAPPPAPTAGATSPVVPVVGTTPVPPTAVSTPKPLPQWEPAPRAGGDLRTAIADLEAIADPTQLQRDQLADYETALRRDTLRRRRLLS